MIEILPTLSFVLPIIAGCLVFLTFTLNLYFRIRNQCLVSVNCWFCNGRSKVLYSLKDSFTCPHCVQYNGFTKDGGYNKIIPEQHDELLNKATSFGNNLMACTTSNRLCTLCNNNQQLKVLQLARFVPMCEENYDREIEHFQTQLEKAYKLCKKCDIVLKKTIDKQSLWIFGNQIKANLVNSSHLKSIINQRITRKMSVFITILIVFSLFLIHLMILWTLLHNKYVHKKLTFYQSSTMLKDLMEHGSGKNAILQNYFPSVGRTENYTLYCCLGLFLQCVLSIISKNPTAEKVNQLLCWVIVTLASTSMRLTRSYTMYIFILQLCCYGYLVYMKFSFKELKEVRNGKKSVTKFKRRQKFIENLENTCSDFSDVSDNEVSTSDSFKTSNGSSLDESFSSSREDQTKTPSGTFQYVPDLNSGLNKLNLGPSSRKSPSPAAVSPFYVTNVVNRPKEVLSPPKFQQNCFNQNSWVAGGYWQSIYVNPNQTTTNHSRSSSESSGFGSQTNENNFSSHNNKMCCDLDGRSVFSEPVHYICRSSNAWKNDRIGDFPPSQVDSRLTPRNRTPVFVDNLIFRPLLPERSLFKPWPECTSVPIQSFGNLAQMGHSK